MHTVTPESLLDEADFVSELSSLEHGLMENRPPPSLSSVTEPPAPLRTAPPGKFVDDVRPSPRSVEDEDSPRLGRLATVGMLVLMMGVGAAGALLVYH
jgi:hypothetical protein